MSDGYKEYVIASLTVRAQKSEGGGFYDVIFPDGEHMKYLSEVFETVAKPVQPKGFPKGD